MTLFRLADHRDRDMLEAMHQAYLEALTSYDHPEVEPHELEDAWFTDQERLFPYVATDGDGLAGHMLVLGPAHAQALGFEVDSYVHELFLRADLRGGGLAQALLEHGLRERPGTWVTEVLEANGPASGFWARALAGRPGLRDEVRGEFRVYWFES
jgi:predicted acetyltransferase